MYLTVITVARLGRDPELRFMPNGDGVCNMSVATDRKWTGNDGQQHKETTWLRVSVFGKQAEACNKFLSKGSLVLIEGTLIPDPKTGGPKVWQGQNGPGAAFEIRANNVRFLSSKNDGNGAGEQDQQYGEAQPTDVPF